MFEKTIEKSLRKTKLEVRKFSKSSLNLSQNIIMKIDFSAYRHIIWDYNGTLLNDVDVCVSVMNEMLSARSLPNMTPEKYRSVFDIPVINYYKILGFDFQKDPFDVVGLEFIRKYDLRRFESHLQSGAEEMLNYFATQNIKQSVLSARKQKPLEEELEYFGIKNYFENISGLGDDYGGSKTENGNRLFEQIGIPKSKILLIGDTVHDFETAQALNIDCILLANGHQSTEKLKKCRVPVFLSLTAIFREI